jgi:phosphinothricin acetyltransferase
MRAFIRQVRPEDAAAILAIYAPYISGTPVTFEEIIPSVDEMATRIESIRYSSPFLVCESDGNIAGYAYATSHRNRSAYRWTRELSVYVHEDYRRKKIGSLLYNCTIRILRYQGIRMVLAGITIPNPESTLFHERFGFVKTAEFHEVGFKQGSWHTVGWWELDLNPGMKEPPGEVIPYCEIPPDVIKSIFREGIREFIPSVIPGDTGK